MTKRKRVSAISPARARALRKSTGLSQELFAKVLGVDRITVWRLEKGEVRVERLRADQVERVVAEMVKP